MALPTSGPISLGDVNEELGKDSTDTISLNDSDVRSLAGIPSGEISLEDLRGKSSISILLSWGNNRSGQLGDNTTTFKNSPVTVVGNITNWKQISAGREFNLAVTTDGIAYAWGTSGQGQLGDGSLGSSRSSPVTVIGGITNWDSVSAGRYHSLGLRDNGIVYAWGSNSFGRLGDGTTTLRASPVTLAGSIADWKQISAGRDHSLGVRENGITYAWGANSFGQLGTGTTVARSSPVTIIGGISNWKQLNAGYQHSLGITENGIAYAWGLNNSGRLGDGTTVRRSSPVTVVGGITNWSQLSGSDQHSLGVTENGIAYAWGVNGAGRLGDGTTIARSSPVTLAGGITNWSQVSAGNAHSLGVTDDGIVYAWGSGGSGRLGDGTFTSRLSPVTVIGGYTNWSQVSAGNNHSVGF